MSLDSGKLRHRIIIQEPDETQDQNSGAVNVSWIDVATLWASIEPISAREFIASDTIKSKVVARITIRYRAGITPKMRIFHAASDSYYNIEGVLTDPASGKEYITIPVSKGVKAG